MGHGIIAKNVTATGFIAENGENEPVVFKIADTVYYSENDGYVSWVVLENGEYYLYSNENSEGQQIKAFSVSVNTILASFHLPSYDKFSYDEVTKSYVTQKPEYPEQIRKFNLHFENGYITKFEARNSAGEITYSFLFTDYGRTKVDLPQEK